MTAEMGQAMRPKVLLVEDEPLIRLVMADALRELDVLVEEAASADEAWAYLTSDGSVDLVFTDHRMPGAMTGAQLAIRIRRDFPRIAVVLTSAHFGDSEWKDPIVAKPYHIFRTAKDLIAMITARAGHQYLERPNFAVA